MSGRPADSHLYDLSLPLRRQLRLAARAALGVSLFALLTLMGTLYFLFRGQSDSYYQVIASLTRSQDQLITAMLLGGAIIVLVAGLMVWFIVLYSSARIAGPLYRFTRNVELEINEGLVQTVQLRKGDYLQELSDKLANAVTSLRQRNERQIGPLTELQQLVSRSPGQRPSPSAYNELVQQLKDSVDRH
jgi:hypothetical protein